MPLNSIKRSGGGDNLPVRRATNDEEINAVREMLLKKRNKKSPTQDEDAIKKSIRVRSLDERIGMKKEKPGALTTMISVQVPDECLLNEDTQSYEENLERNQGAGEHWSHPNIPISLFP
jgi:hypothetical protein